MIVEWLVFGQMESTSIIFEDDRLKFYDDLGMSGI